MSVLQFYVKEKAETPRVSSQTQTLRIAFHIFHIFHIADSATSPLTYPCDLSSISPQSGFRRIADGVNGVKWWILVVLGTLVKSMHPD